MYISDNNFSSGIFPTTSSFLLFLFLWIDLYIKNAKNTTKNPAIIILTIKIISILPCLL